MRFAGILCATNRIMKSNTNFAEFMKNVPEQVAPRFKDLINYSQGLSAGLAGKPEEKPVIDFEFYKSRITDKAFVQKLESFYNNEEIPYPKDLKNVRQQIAEAKKQSAAKVADLVEKMDYIILEQDLYLKAAESVPPFARMTVDMYRWYFPEQRVYGDKRAAVLSERNDWMAGYTYGFFPYKWYEMEAQVNLHEEAYPEECEYFTKTLANIDHQVHQTREYIKEK